MDVSLALGFFENMNSALSDIGINVKKYQQNLLRGVNKSRVTMRPISKNSNSSGASMKSILVPL